ncbi:MAG: nuclease [Candidatus Parabeggiatoa sp. nov. 2]|nr:MAG: nuclease [Beggiatoa sp. 4572_84]RKZ63569.1 MAG: nuclease [Gammaproteobacteria bacterium]
MPFENELASYEPLRRILDSKKVQNIKKRFKIRQSDNEDGELSLPIIHKDKLEPSDWQPYMVIAIDGSCHLVKAENGFPGAEFGYVTVASVIIFLNKIRELENEEFINPKEFRETEDASTIDTVFPGCNVIIDDEDSAKSSMRKALFEELKNNHVFEEGETLLDTYEVLSNIKREKHGGHPPKCPCDLKKEYEYGIGEYSCNHCGKTLYSSDALRLHELMNPEGGSSGEMFGQIMSTFERLWLIHILRAFEKRKLLPTLRRIAFMLDGPLAVFSTSSWLTKSIIDELRRLNELAKKVNHQELLILGIEKSGTFVNHFEDIDTTKEGISDHFPNQSALLLDDEYIKKNIIFSESEKPYGQDTYFGRKFFYKTSLGYRIVPSIAFFSEYQQDLKTAFPNQFSRLADIMNLLNQVVSSRYKNSVSPLISAHAEAAIPLNLGRSIFEEMARELRGKS